MNGPLATPQRADACAISGRKRTSRPPPAARKFNPLVLSEIQNAGDTSTGPVSK
jgi:hypothetical protein